MATASVEAVINALYVTMYGRTADYNGFAHWASQAMWGSASTSTLTVATAKTSQATNAQAQALADQFESSQSAYFTATYGGLGDMDFIRALYLNLGGSNQVAATDLLYWKSILDNFSGDRGKLAGEFTFQFLTVNLTESTDTAAIGRQQTFLNKVLVSEDWVAQSQGKTFMNAALVTDAAFTAQMTILAGISSAISTREAATAQIDAAETAASLAGITGQAVVGTVFALTTAADTITGTNSTDTISGTIGSWSNSDDIHGGGGTDTFTVRVSGALAPSVSAVEIFDITSRSAGASIDFADVKGMTALTLHGTSIALTGLTNNMTAKLQSFSGMLCANISSGALSSNGLTLIFDSASSGNLSAPNVDALTLVVNTAATLGGRDGVGSAAELSAITISGTAALTLNLNTAASGLTTTALTAINGSAAGAVTVNIGAAQTGNMNITLGTGNDVIKIYGSSVSTAAMTGTALALGLDLGGGTDTVAISVDTALGTFRPAWTGVESVFFDVNTALSASFSQSVGVTAITLRQTTAAVFSAMGSSTTTWNIESANGTASTLTMTYPTAGAGGSIVNVNYQVAATTAFETSTQTQTAMSAGLLTFAGNSGQLNINIGGTATGTVLLEAVNASATKVITVSATNQHLTMNSGGDFETATALNIFAHTATVTIGGVLSANSGNGVAVNLQASGVSALIDLSGLSVTNMRTLNINAGAGGTGQLMVSANDITWSANTADQAGAHGSAFDLTSVTISAVGGDVSIGTAHIASALSAVSAQFNNTWTITLANTANSVTIAEISAATGIATGIIQFNVAGSGSFNLNSAILPSAGMSSTQNSGGITLKMSLTGLSCASTAIIAVTGQHCAGSVSISAGLNYGSFIGGSGNDTITFGLGAFSAAGGMGNDTYNMTTAANYIFVQSGLGFTAGTAMGADTVNSIGTGDVIILKSDSTSFLALTGTATRSASTAATGLTTGGIINGPWTSVSTAAFNTGVVMTAGISNPFAIYTSNGNTIVEVLLGTAAIGATATAATASNTVFNTSQIAVFTLDGKDITAISAVFQVDYSTALGGYALTVIG